MTLSELRHMFRANLERATNGACCLLNVQPGPRGTFIAETATWAVPSGILLAHYYKGDHGVCHFVQGGSRWEDIALDLQAMTPQAREDRREILEAAGREIWADIQAAGRPDGIRTFTRVDPDEFPERGMPGWRALAAADIE
jgi:hypothetical protein